MKAMALDPTIARQGAGAWRSVRAHCATALSLAVLAVAALGGAGLLDGPATPAGRSAPATAARQPGGLAPISTAQLPPLTIYFVDSEEHRALLQATLDQPSGAANHARRYTDIVVVRTPAEESVFKETHDAWIQQGSTVDLVDLRGR